MAPINMCDRKKHSRLSTNIIRCTMCCLKVGAQAGGNHVMGKNFIHTDLTIIYERLANDRLHPSSYHTPCSLEMVRKWLGQQFGISTASRLSDKGFSSSNITQVHGNSGDKGIGICTMNGQTS